MTDIRKPLLDAIDAAAIADSAESYVNGHPTDEAYGVEVSWSDRSGLSASAYYAMHKLLAERIERSMASLLTSVVEELRADADTKLSAARAALSELIEASP